MKTFYSGILLILLAVSMVLPTVGCQPVQSEKEQHQPIKIEEDPAYSDETMLWAEQTIFSLVLYTYRNAVMDRISEKTEARLKSYAHRICQITAAKTIPEEQYRSVIALLEITGVGNPVINELCALQKGEATTIEKTRAFYLELVYAFGADCVASMMYEGCLLIYDARYEKAVERLEEYQYPWYQEEVDAVAAERAVFAEGIGEESFSTLLRFSTAIAELLAVNPEELPQMFSDAEILDMVRRLDMSKIHITQEGWELLLSKTPQLKENPYFESLVQAFKESDDLSCVAAVMNDAVALLSSVLNGLASEDLANLRAGEWEEFMTAVFSRFDDDDWELFTSITSGSLANEKYSALAVGEYGEAYLEYLSSIEQVDVKTLRASVDDANFCQNLFNYLAAICPAISYEVNS